MAVLNDEDYLRLLLAAEPEEQEEEEEELREAEEDLEEEEEEEQEGHDGAYIEFDAMDFATALGHELRRYPSLLELHQLLVDPIPAIAGDGEDDDDLAAAAAALKETMAPSDGSGCPICLLDDEDEDEEDAAMAKGPWKETACGHRFHGPCIDKWLSAKGSCPLCRQQLLETTTDAAAAPGDPDLVWNDLLGLYGEELLVADSSFVDFFENLS